MKKISFRLACVLVGLLASFFSTTYAQTTESESLQSIVVAGVKDPAMLPYKKAYDLASKVYAVGENRVRLLFRATSSKTKEPISNLEINIVGDHHSEKLDVSKEGFFSIPIRKEQYEENADFITNQKQGTLRVGISLAPNLPAGGFDYATVLKAIEAARAVRAELLPWYIRFITPNINGIGICYSDVDRSVAVENAEKIRPASIIEKNDAGEKMLCANFSSAESLDFTTKIMPANGWEPLFLTSLF